MTPKNKMIILVLKQKTRTRILWAQVRYTYPTRMNKGSKDPIQTFVRPTQVLPNIPGPVVFAHTSSSSSFSSFPENTTNQNYIIDSVITHTPNHRGHHRLNE